MNEAIDLTLDSLFLRDTDSSKANWWHRQYLTTESTRSILTGGLFNVNFVVSWGLSGWDLLDPEFYEVLGREEDAGLQHAYTEERIFGELSRASSMYISQGFCAGFSCDMCGCNLHLLNTNRNKTMCEDCDYVFQNGRQDLTL